MLWDFFVQNWLGIVLATAAAMLIGGLWYSPMVFGKQWQQLAGLKDSAMKSNRTQAMVAMLAMAFITAFVLKRFLVIANPATTLEALKVASWIWFGFIVTYVVGGGLFEKRPVKLMVLNLGNQLVTLLVMAVILFKI